MYYTDRKEDVESVLVKQGYSFEWKGDDLKVWWNHPAMRKHDKTGNWYFGGEVGNVICSKS